MNQIKYRDRSISADNGPAAARAKSFHQHMENMFGNVTKVGGKQIYKIKNGKQSVLLRIVSAPSNTKLTSAIKGELSECGLPMYVVFTRNPKDWPSGGEYWNNIKKVNKLRSKFFKGTIMGLGELIQFQSDIKKGRKIHLSIERYVIASDGNSEIEDVLKSFGVSGKNVKICAEIINKIKK